MAASHTGAPSSGNCVNLINKYNTGRVLLAFLKQISYTGSTHTYEHLHKIRTGDREKRNARFPCHGFCQESLTCSRRAYEKNTLGNSGTYFHILLGTFQEIHDLPKLLLLFLKPCHILKGNALLTVHRHFGTALAEIHHLGIAAA